MNCCPGSDGVLEGERVLGVGPQAMAALGGR